MAWSGDRRGVSKGGSYPYVGIYFAKAECLKPRGIPEREACAEDLGTMGNLEVKVRELRLVVERGLCE